MQEPLEMGKELVAKQSANEEADADSREQQLRATNKV
jgi:hypothetical protein